MRKAKLSAMTSKRDARGHYEGCDKFDEKAAPAADPNSAYIDMFCDCHKIPLPEVGANGTDVIWPAGWTEPEARFWRAWRGILRPGDTAPEGCPRCRGTEFVCENHMHEPWGEPGMHRDGEGAPCPVSSAWAYPSDNDGDQKPQPIGPTWLSADSRSVAA